MGSIKKTILEKIKPADTQNPDRKAGQKVEEAPSGKRPSLIALIIPGIALLAILCIVGIVSFGKGLISPVMPTAAEASTLTESPTEVTTEAPTEVVTEAPPIVQSACVLKGSKYIGASRQLAEFLLSPEALAVKRKYGYK